MEPLRDEHNALVQDRQRLVDRCALLQERVRELEAEVERLRVRLGEWENAAQVGHKHPCTLGPLCPYCEIERLQRELDVRRFEARQVAEIVGYEEPSSTDEVIFKVGGMKRDNERLRGLLNASLEENHAAERVFFGGYGVDTDAEAYCSQTWNKYLAARGRRAALDGGEGENR